MNRRYIILLTTDDDDKTLKEVKEMLEGMGAEEVGNRSGMRMGGGVSGSRGGYKRDSRGYPMDVTNLRSGNRSYHDKEQEVEALEEQIHELKMRKKQLESEDDGLRYGGAYGPY